MKIQNPILLAFSGGLDTSFCVPWLKDTYKRPVVTITVNTGGLDDDATEALQARALELGAERHLTVDARAEFFDRVLRFLIYGNVRRGQLYPLCVGAEEAYRMVVDDGIPFREAYRRVAERLRGSQR